ncbi:beta-lactamase family protein [Paenibacillus sp. Marseille-P2973]|uniref:serine hydrolase domain-containing protein n=1 Tax=Paenibacillus sp. Marseille-P2973 TaxID=1871032 RepID=UPI001B38A060|nr:serine hydrolase domain-containing protein [Paenibacillus sp. Marseille-P2973]MBQ4898782.1 beta-lactamase family protein [Paenibacillus sp. Marseille-P2973]
MKKNLKKASVLIVMIICLLTVGCTANDEIKVSKSNVVTPSEIKPIASSEVESLSDIIDAYLSKLNFNGSVLLAKNGKVLVRQGYGMANWDKELPNGPTTIFRIGSVTKQFTALAIMQLQEQGKLNVNDPVHTYLPDYPHSDQITIHHLLTHTSGIPNLTEFPNYLETMGQPVTVEQNLSIFKNEPLEFEPGSEFRYSNSGYILLGAIIEQVSKQTYEDYVSEHIFKPLGMNDSGFRDGESTDPKYAVGYMNILNEPLQALPIDMSVPYSAGAMLSSIDDLHKWDQALNTEQLINKSLADAMFTPFKDQYAYGWVVMDGGRKIYFHNGGINGFTAYIKRYVLDDMTVIVLSNYEGTDINNIGDRLGVMLNESP